MNMLKESIKNFWNDEEGLQTLEIMLIIAVIVVIALLFRDRIMGWIEDLLKFGDDNISEFQ
ncbi:Flp1 family type IVb pilin [Oceanobacillus polygoni]|uniref:Flp pilus assembly pilin Flp n=1 Tax=Oceanobacillus polygoni TaxID=1235259 RepID=A0A9X1CGZ2_9BACI|nr:Flp1 family type IVb pilin [Oceanobacillus polygoni]MBP2077502.1 Flp pilus assembly pilin Flp [Oceanobacillus polygoni]